MRRLMVLVVNDDTPLHRLVMRTLERWFPQALLLEANSLQEALPALRSFTPAALVAGDHLFDGTPVRLLHQARLCHPTMPVFMLSANARDAAVGVAGATQTFVLPQGLSELVATLQALQAPVSDVGRVGLHG